MNDGRADYIPVFLHEAPKLFYDKKLVPDIALIHVSMPDARGFCSLGVSADCTRAAVCTAKVIIGSCRELFNNYTIVICMSLSEDQTDQFHF